ncbi:MAG: arginine--tRNA ligase [Bacteroidales bacterium]|jgi:arginyl-tRNA synthetase|nr:arginine--tRNA ligase [Bacteroidales bacterium]
MSADLLIVASLKDAVKELYNQEVDDKMIQLQMTRKDVEGDVTVVVFPLLRLSRKSPEQTAEDLGNYLKTNLDIISDYNVIKGFLNVVIDAKYWVNQLNNISKDDNFGLSFAEDTDPVVMIEYSSPNTNKPLHLGHIRNNLLGYSIAKIAAANKKRVVKTNIVNDRGIHICKSMLAWQKFGNSETPESTGKKGDHLVGDYYVKFDKEYKKEIAALVAEGQSEDDAKKSAPLMLEAQEMLRKWEAGDHEVNELWRTMNGWVYDGFDVTYKRLGVDFDKIYYESDTYKLGKKSVLEGLDKGVFHKKDNGSVWANLESDGLDEKLLLRADGTSVYMTQDIGTAEIRHDDFGFEDMIYVVGNEQNYHFQVLSLILGKLGYEWADKLYHLSYGMVELPEGKMKSREGTVVDADDLIDTMINTAREMSEENGKLEGYSVAEKENIYRIIGLGALKYFILKVDPRKNMTFNPRESIDFNGNTGPFIQYTYARIQSLKRKAAERGIEIPNEVVSGYAVNAKEIEIIKQLNSFETQVKDAWKNHSPAQLANYIYDLVKEYNQYYHDYYILNEEDETTRIFRLQLSAQLGEVVKRGLDLMGIEVPERM